MLKTKRLDSLQMRGDPQMGKSKTNLKASIGDEAQKPSGQTSIPNVGPAVAQIRAQTSEPFIRRLALWVSIILGLGFILPNFATTLMLAYFLSTFTVSSQLIVIQMSGTISFLLGSILLMVLGIVIINWGIRYYTNASYGETAFIGVILGSFYLFCVGIGSALLAPQIGASEVLLLTSPVLIMISVALHTTPYISYKVIGALLGIASGLSLIFALFYLQPLRLVFMGWNTGWDSVSFPGPFMSLALPEGLAIVAGAVAASVKSLSPGQKTRPASYVLFSIIGLVYGTGLFIGAFLLSFSLLNIAWKAPWLPPLYGLPTWIFSVVIFWSASLIILEIGGLVLIVLSCLGFITAAKEFSQLSQN